MSGCRTWWPHTGRHGHTICQLAYRARQGDEALALDRSHDRKDLARGELFVAEHLHPTPRQLARGPRIGVAYAGAWATKRLRFWWHDHPAVSRMPASSR